MTKPRKARFGMTMDPELQKKIDEKRGLISRAAFIEYGMKQFLELEGLRKDEIVFYKDIMDMLRKLMSEEKRGNVLSGISLISSKISGRREQLIGNGK